MLRKIRKGDIKKVLWVLVIVIVPAFVFWGANWFIKGKSALAGKIYGRKISPQEYQGFLRNTQVLFLLQFGRDFLTQIKSQDLKDYIWQNLLFAEKAKRENIKVTDQEVLRYIETFPFLNTDQGFSKERYLNTLRSLNVVPSQFEDFLRDQIRVEKLKRTIFQKIKVTEEEIKERYKKDNEEAKAKYVFVSFKKIEDKINPQEAELKDFFKKNKEDFKIPPKVKIAYTLIKEPQSKIIKNIESKIKKKKDLKSICKENKLQITESNFFSLDEPIKGLGWQKDIAKKAFQGKLKEVYGPLKISEGVIFFEKIAQKDYYLPEFSEVAEKVKKEFIKKKAYSQAKKLSYEIISKIRKENIKDLEKIKTVFPDIEVKETDFFKRKDYVENIGLEKRFNAAVFALKKGEIFLNPIEAKKGFSIVQLLDLKPLDEEKFKKEKEKYRKQILEEKRASAFRNYILKLIKESNLVIYRLP